MAVREWAYFGQRACKARIPTSGVCIVLIIAKFWARHVVTIYTVTSVIHSTPFFPKFTTAVRPVRSKLQGARCETTARLDHYCRLRQARRYVNSAHVQQSRCTFTNHDETCNLIFRAHTAKCGSGIARGSHNQQAVLTIRYARKNHWDFEDLKLKKSPPPELQAAEELNRLKELISKRLRNSVAPGPKL